MRSTFFSSCSLRVSPCDKFSLKTRKYPGWLTSELKAGRPFVRGLIHGHWQTQFAFFKVELGAHFKLHGLRSLGSGKLCLSRDPLPGLDPCVAVFALPGMLTRIPRLRSSAVNAEGAWPTTVAARSWSKSGGLVITWARNSSGVLPKSR